MIIKLQLATIARDINKNRQPLKVALEMLVRAYQYAQDTNVDRWEFAIPVSEFRHVGLTISELRWLLFSGVAVHAQEVIQGNGHPPKFARLGIRSLPPDACFVLSDHGVQALEPFMQGPPAEVKPLLPKEVHYDGIHQNGPGLRIAAAVVHAVPHWNTTKLELVFHGRLVKAFRSPAPNQQRILTVFQEECWKRRIDDPLPPEPEQDSRERLRNAIKQLNRNQVNPLLRFCGDGSGNGVVWQSIVSDPILPGLAL